MNTCGYICPACEGREYDEDGKVCIWCSNEENVSEEKEENLKDWIAKVHEGPCCGDL